MNKSKREEMNREKERGERERERDGDTTHSQEY